MNTEDDNNDIEFVIDSNSDDSSVGERVTVESSVTSKESTTSEAKKKASSGVEKKLWNVAKKYKAFFDKDEVPQIAESEEDRKEVSEAYQEISTKRHRQLDSRVYHSLTKMQRTRDAKVALEGTTEKDRLRMIAWEVKIRLQPIIFTAGDSTIEMDIFNLHDSGTDVRIIEGLNEDLLVEDNIVDGQGIAIMDDLPLRNLTKEQKAKLKIELIKKFGGQIFSKEEFDKKITSLEADLVSLMVREKQIMLMKHEKNRFQIVPIEDAMDIDFAVLESESLVITPRMEQMKRITLRK